MHQNLQQRIRELEKSFDQLSDQFQVAFKYSSTDPQASLNKVRIILEKIIRRVYKNEVGEPPEELMIGAALRDPQLRSAIDRRILSKMNAIRSMSNLAVHGEYVTTKDAMHSIDNLCDIMDWYMNKYEIASQYYKKRKTKRILLISVGVLIVLSLAAVGSWYLSLDSESGSAETQTSANSESEALAFVKDFETSINGDDLDHIVSFYADRVRYYGKMQRRSEIWMDKKSFLNRWKERYYFVSSPINILSTDGFTYEMTYEVSYNAKDNFRNAQTEGTWEVYLKISQKKDGGFEVIEIDGGRNK